MNEVFIEFLQVVHILGFLYLEINRVWVCIILYPISMLAALYDAHVKDTGKSFCGSIS